ncbi:MAG: AMP-binding protein [Prevotella sp.]|nr:AMP-binding protein [Prevotella sp.]
MTLDEFVSDWQSDSPTLLVHTSGSTGKPKPMLVEKRRMEASARITCGFLGLRAGDTALLCMPLDFIAGKMVVVRSLVWGLQLMAVEPSGHPLKGLTESPTFAAMVPMQVYNSLKVEEERRLLRDIKHLIIGGGAVNSDMAEELRGFPNAVWSTYGMTETLSHIALRRLSGAEASEWYEPFDGVGVTTSADGCLVIDAPAVCAQPLVTNDIAEIAPDGRRFRIRGRRDNVVCSGGLKLQIEEMEARLQPHLNVPYMISKRPDDKFGEAVVLLAVTDDMESVCEVCRKHMPRYEQPRYFLAVSELPMTPTGKPARAEAMKLCAAMTSGK